MAELIEHSGTVERTEAGKVFVRITSHSACGACSARQACGLAETQEKIVEVAASEAGAFAPGDAVTVGVRRRIGILSVAKTFGMLWHYLAASSIVWYVGLVILLLL